MDRYEVVKNSIFLDQERTENRLRAFFQAHKVDAYQEIDNVVARK